MSLVNEKCEACRVDAPKMSDEERAALMRQIPDWQAVVVNGIQQLRRVYEFRNFSQALAFTNRIGSLADDAGHHPALLTEWGKVTVNWWTHDIGGLHKNDFIMAARTEAAFDQTQSCCM